MTVAAEGERARFTYEELEGRGRSVPRPRQRRQCAAGGGDRGGVAAGGQTRRGSATRAGAGAGLAAGGAVPVAAPGGILSRLAFHELRGCSSTSRPRARPETGAIFWWRCAIPRDAPRDLLEGASATSSSARRADRTADPDSSRTQPARLDLPFWARRAEILGVPWSSGAARARRSARALRRADGATHAPGRELIDTMDAVLRHDFSGAISRARPQAVARHFGWRARTASSSRRRVHDTPARPGAGEALRRGRVDEAAGLARLSVGRRSRWPGWPRRYERLADAGPATGSSIRAVRRTCGPRRRCPRTSRAMGPSTAGRRCTCRGRGAHRIVKADVASLYPSLMREHGSGRGAIAWGRCSRSWTVGRSTLAAKGGQAAPAGSAAATRRGAVGRDEDVVNSAYGYLGAAGSPASRVMRPTRSRGGGGRLAPCDELAAPGHATRGDTRV